jgi:glycosyltransferase involved in cell wall biosynthesis
LKNISNLKKSKNKIVQEQINISVIIPIYNGEAFIKKCLDALLVQKNIKNYEIIVIDDASTDNSLNIVNSYKLNNLKIFSLPSNSGPSAARNLGLKKSLGEYIYFFDVDDSIDSSALEILYKTAKETNCDYVFSDFKKFEGQDNQRHGVYNYLNDTLFKNIDIVKAMKRELHDASLGHLGLFGCNGRLIKRSLLEKNKIFFDEKLRWMEDKTFGWNVLSHVKEARYIHKQLYSYYFHPNIKTNVTESLNRGSSLFYIKLILDQVQNSLKTRLVPEVEIIKLRQQGLIFFSIQSLVTCSNQIFLKKIDKITGKQIRKKLIKSILEDEEVSQAIRVYSRSKSESPWIPKAIYLKSTFLLEIACDLRAKDIAKKRRSKQ